MKKYLVMIDDDISSIALTFDELLDYGLLDDYDVHIKVKATDDNLWYVAREYPFHISEKTNPNYVVNEDGTVTRRGGTDSTRIHSSESTHNVGNSSSQTSNVTTSNDSSSSSEDTQGCIWAIIIAIGIVILYAFLK